ncbi:uncharacterized protein LOC100205776 isoform X1 [Hydra vulgaris]|uniref:uncharacterized protein LOC100205776 isoform X1 n=1 Tax=Hydra vulgaris TaxID=6087 RepID=UPI0002B4D5D3|nr:uncharacterized protein LOC100205776 [Hydra vulgaris]
MVSENEFIAIKDDIICPEDFDKIDLKSNTPEDVVVDTLNCVSNVRLVQNNNGLSLTLKKTSMDITKTRQYKEIYADNLRQYSFLLSKQLGISNQSNNELRKQYLQSRQRESERRSLQCKNEEKKSSPETYKKSTLHLPLVSLRCSNRDLRKSSCPNLLSPVNEEQFNTNKHEESSDSKFANSYPILSKKCSMDFNDCQNNEHQHKSTVINHRSKTATKKYIQRGFTQPNIPFGLRRSNENIGNYQAHSLTNLALPLSEMESNENQLDISNLLNSDYYKEYLQSKQKEINKNNISPDHKKTSPRLNLMHKEKYYSLRKCSCPNLQSQFDEQQPFYVECDNLSQSKSEGSSPQLSKKLTSSLINIPDFHKQEHQCKSIANTISHQSRDKNNKYPQQELTQSDDAIDLQRYMESFGKYRSYSLTNLSFLINEKKTQEYNSKILLNYSSQRQREAEERYHWRLSRLDSFEGMLAKVNSYINEERRNSNPDLNQKFQ